MPSFNCPVTPPCLPRLQPADLSPAQRLVFHVRRSTGLDYVSGRWGSWDSEHAAGQMRLCRDPWPRAGTRNGGGKRKGHVGRGSPTPQGRLTHFPLRLVLSEFLPRTLRPIPTRGPAGLNWSLAPSPGDSPPRAARRGRVLAHGAGRGREEGPAIFPLRPGVARGGRGPGPPLAFVAGRAGGPGA